MNTTPNLPDAAIKAAADFLQEADIEDHPDPRTTDHFQWCKDNAEAMLEAAIPLLGEAEYAVRVDYANGVSEVFRKETQAGAERWSDIYPRQENEIGRCVVSRIVTEWTDMP